MAASFTKRILRIVIATAVVVASVAVDSHRERSARAEQAKTLLRQVASQAQGLFYYAQQVGEQDPIAWVVRNLGQGSDPRYLEVRKTTATAKEEDGWEEDTELRQFQLTRVLAMEKNQAITLQLTVPYRGFMGSLSRATNDGLTLALWVLTYLSVVAVMRIPRSRRAGKSKKTDVHEPVFSAQPLPAIDPDVLQASVRKLGQEVRDLIRDARSMGQAGSQSRRAMERTRAQLHEQLNEIRALRKALQSADQGGAQAEAQALNLVLATSRLGIEGSAAAKQAKELHEWLRSRREQNAQTEARLRKLEIAVEPMIADADEAMYAFEAMRTATQSMDPQITKVVQSFMSLSETAQSARREPRLSA